MHGRWLAILGCVAAVVAGCRQSEPSAQTAASTDPKAQIYRHLVKQTGQKQFTPGMDLELFGRVSTLRSNATVLEQRAAALREALRAADDEPAGLQKEIETLRGELRVAEQAAGEARTRLQEAEKREPRNDTEVASRQAERTARESEWNAKRATFAAREVQLETERAARKQQRAALERQFEEARRAWEAARTEANHKQEELSNQDDEYIRAVRQRMSEVRSYDNLYRMVGQLLATADRLLAEPDLSRRRIGLRLAKEACNHVNSDSVDVWLAARICEAYFWPNLSLADGTSDARERKLELLETARRVFFDTDETNSVLRNYELLMAHAPDARAADHFRVQLADWLEEKGALQRAAEILNEIRDAQVLSSAEERITRVKERVASIP